MVLIIPLGSWGFQISPSGDLKTSTPRIIRTYGMEINKNQLEIKFSERYLKSSGKSIEISISNPTCMDEARAWKFAAKAPGTNMRVMETLSDGATVNSFTAAHIIKTNSVRNVADWFKNGNKGWIDSDNRQHFMINKSYNPLQGLYHHLPKK